jgi:hypothetical protein
MARMFSPIVPRAEIEKGIQEIDAERLDIEREVSTAGCLLHVFLGRSVNA